MKVQGTGLRCGSARNGATVAASFSQMVVAMDIPSQSQSLDITMI
jgi:hypothetical protein